MNVSLINVSSPRVPSILGRVRRFFSFSPAAVLVPRDDDESLARREFILEMMSRHPDAFSNDADVYAMRSMFPDRF